VDFLASPSQLQENGQAQKITAISGQNCLELYHLSNRHGASLRMCVDYLVSRKGWYSRIVCLTWKPLVTSTKRLLFQLVPSTPNTDETEFGLFATPTTQEVDSDCKLNESGRRMTKDWQSSHSLNLARQVKMWTTPTAHNAKEGGYPAEYERKSPTLAAEANAGMPAKMWPTPQASDDRDRGNLSSGAITRRREKGKQIMLSQSVSQESGALNPDWVENLMGYPVGWTNLDCQKSASEFLNELTDLNNLETQ
jgi:hypothetical protein